MRGIIFFLLLVSVLWGQEIGKPFVQVGHSSFVHSISITPDGKYVLSGSGDRTLKLWEIETGKEIHTLKGHTWSVYSVAITPDGKYVLSGSGDDTLKLWEIKRGKEIRTFRGHKSSVYSVAITPDGKYVLSDSGDDTLKLWEIKTGKEIRTFKGYPNRIISVAITLDGRYVLSGSGDDTIKLWEINTGKEIRTFKGHTNRIISVAITPDGKYSLSASEDKTLKLREIKTGKEIRTFKGNNSPIVSVAITPDGKYILSGSLEGAVKLLEIKTGKEMLNSISFEDGEWITITPEGYFNASKNGANHLNVLTGPMSVTSVDAYYKNFYRPNIINLAMQGKTVDTGVKISDIKPAPIVVMLQIPQKTDKKQVEVTLKIKEMGGGIGDVRIYRNGTAVALKSRDVQRSQKDLTYKTFVIPLEKGKNKLEAIAFESTNSLRSEPAIKNMFASYVDTTKPSLHAVIIGIEEFRNNRLNLLYTKNDATALKETLEKHTQTLFDKVDVTLLTSKEETSKENITKVLESLTNLNPNDLFLLFIASHGTVDDGDYYLITSNVGSTRTEKLKKDALSQADITKLISNIPTGKKLIVLDTCHSGALGESIKIALLQRGMSEDTAIKILSRATGTTILSASLSTQQALEGYKGHGLFSYVLLEGIKGKSDLNGDGFIKTPELVDYIDERVPGLSQEVFGVEQFPTVNLDGQAFPITQIVK